MRPLRERLRYIELRGTLRQDGSEWVWVAAPDTKCEVRELRSESKFTVVELVYDILKGIKI
jgi:hypothetical protein